MRSEKTCTGEYTRGMVAENVDPNPTSLLTETLPPSNSASCYFAGSDRIAASDCVETGLAAEANRADALAALNLVTPRCPRHEVVLGLLKARAVAGAIVGTFNGLATFSTGEGVSTFGAVTSANTICCIFRVFCSAAFVRLVLWK